MREFLAVLRHDAAEISRNAYGLYGSASVLA